MHRIRLMTPADIPLGMRLKSQAGWNQTEADWRRFLAISPEGCFVAEWDGVPVGTTVACIFGSVAWIAMVLVDEAVRGRGVGRALLDHALEFLDRRGVATVRLDATPLGRPLYEKLGFAAQFEIVRYSGVVPDNVRRTSLEIVTPSASDYPALLALDHTVTQTGRSPFLTRLFAERPEETRAMWREGELAGWLTARQGSEAVQIGPCMALPAAGEALLLDAMRRHEGKKVYVDVPLANRPEVSVVETLGLVRQRTLTRMCRGRSLKEDLTRLRLSSGPELG